MLVSPNGSTDVGSIALQHRSIAEPFPFTGMVDKEASDDESGARIQIVNQYGEIVGEGISAVDGTFSINAAGDETYTVTITAPAGCRNPRCRCQ